MSTATSSSATPLAESPRKGRVNPPCQLGVPVKRSLPSETDDGRIVRVDVGEATIRLQGLQFHTPVIFAQENEPSLLGIVSLEHAALAVDPLAGRLIPTNLLRL